METKWRNNEKMMNICEQKETNEGDWPGRESCVAIQTIVLIGCTIVNSEQMQP
ncbi:MAG: hypothetical protein VB099_00285 [Candidatus Limiplasma sp.]|nr:hypothetical protein [Candidatus Limiplasma sp.]